MAASIFQYAFYFFLGYFLVLLAYYLYCSAVALMEVRGRGRQQSFEDFEVLYSSLFTLPVSIIIPAHNEEDWILDSVQAALDSRYPEFEVIVVDDGSNDRTLALLRERYGLIAYYDHPSQEIKRLPTGAIKHLFFSEKEPRLHVISKEAGFKKAGAVNAGIEFSRYPYFCMLDADTVLEPDGLLKVMAHVVKDPEHIIAAGSYFGLVNGFNISAGMIVERNFSINPLVAYQNLEYLRAFIGTRPVWSKFNATAIISGGFAIWRRDVMLEMGGFAPEYSSEDIEATFRAQEYIRRHPEKGYRLLMLPYFVGWTEGPATFGALIKQRDRWQRCVLEAIAKYKYMFVNPRYRSFGFFAVPYLLFYESFGVFFEVSSIIVTAAGFLAGAYDARLMLTFFIFIALTQAIISLVSIFAFVRDQGVFRIRFLAYLIALSLTEFLWYRWLIMIAKAKGTFNFLRGIRHFDQYTREQKRQTVRNENE